MKKFYLILLFTFSLLQIKSQNYYFQWAGAMGGSLQDYSYGLTLDKNGNTLTTGYFKSTSDFNPDTIAVNNLTANGADDIYVSKLDPLGNYIWAKSFGGSGIDYGLGIATDATNNVYVTGYFSDTVVFDQTSASGTLISNGGKDIFVLKLDANGGFVWVQQFGGLNDDIGYSVTIDNLGNVLTTGIFYSLVDFQPSNQAVNFLTSAGGGDVFVSKLDAAGNYVWAKNVGGTSDDTGRDIKTDKNGDVYVTGYFMNAGDFDPSSTTANLISNGLDDIFALKLSSTGNYIWAKNMGGSTGDYGYALTLDKSDNVLISGMFQNTADFDPSSTGTANLVSAGNHDAFVLKLDNAGNYSWAKQISGSDYEYAFDLTADNENDIYIVGRYMGTVDFNPGTVINNITSNGTNDAFILKLDSTGTYKWVYSFGGPTTDAINSIEVNANKELFITGIFINTVDFDPSPINYNLTSLGSSDIFVQKLSQSATGIQSFNDKNLFNIFPNPSDGLINVSLEFQNNSIQTQLIIYNQLGQIAYKTDYIAQQLDLRHLNSGIYWVKLINNKGIQTKKIIIY